MRVLRRRLDNYVQFGSFAFLALLLAAALPWPVRFVAGAVFAVLAVRTLRAGVVVDDEAGITVRNTFGTHRIPWDDYSRVDVHPSGAIPIPAIVIRRKAGSPVALWCLQPPGRGKRGVPRQVAVLREVQSAIRTVRPDAGDKDND